MLRWWRPSAREVREFRESRDLTREQFVAPLGIAIERIKDYETERAQMSAHLWMLVRITWDPLVRAQWLQWIQKRTEQ